MNRRAFLKTATGLLIGAAALQVPERRVWALDRTMIPTGNIDYRIRYIPDWIDALTPLAPHERLDSIPAWDESMRPLQEIVGVGFQPPAAVVHSPSFDPSTLSFVNGQQVQTIHAHVDVSAFDNDGFSLTGLDPTYSWSVFYVDDE